MKENEPLSSHTADAHGWLSAVVRKAEQGSKVSLSDKKKIKNKNNDGSG